MTPVQREPLSEDRAEAQRKVSPLASLVGRLAHDLRAVAPPGDVAALRRMRPEEVGCPAFWRIVATHLEPAGVLPGEAQARARAERRWAALLAGMAETKGLHAPGRRTGQALAKVLSEPRFLRLVRAQGDALLDALRLAAHQLAARAEPADWAGLARLVLSDGASNEESVRRTLARDYYGQLARQG